MSFLLKNLIVIDSGSTFHKKKVDLLIDADGHLQSVDENIAVKADEIHDFNGHYVSIGWCDLGTSLTEPGLEYIDDVRSLRKTATNGGYTQLGVFPNTDPVLQTKDQLKVLLSGNENESVSLLPISAITKDTKGKELTDMIDLHKAGSMAFSDGQKTIWHSGILLKSLQYAQTFDGVVVLKPYDHYLSQDGLVNEGINSTRKGLKGLPSVAEELAIQEALEILRYTGGRLHFHTISTARAVSLISNAKKEGLQVTCDVAAHQIAFTDDVIQQLDTNYKVFPPFREKEDVIALKEGIKEGVIDCVVANHTPWDDDSKKLEFDHAEFGILGLETCFPILLKELESSIERSIDLLTKTPQLLLTKKVSTIQEGERANLTIFDPTLEWTYTKTKSKSSNSPFLGQTLRGRAIATFHNNKLVVNQ